MATRKKRVCPPWCHRCPKMPNNEVMPQCMGTINGPNPNDLSRCTCKRSGFRKVVLLARRAKRALDILGQELENLASMASEALDEEGVRK